MTTKIHYNHRLGIMSDHSRRLSRLLSLPPAVRQLIFEHLIPVGEASFPVKSLARPHDYSIKESDRTCYALLLTCRMLYKEVVPIVYSTKHFIDQYRRSHLQRLQRLMPTALHSLKKLTILLNVSTCEPGWFCCKERFGHTQSGCAQHDELLGSTPPHQAIIAEWYRTIDHIAPHIQDSSLSLYFICDVVDIDTAIAAVKPLLDQSLPTLAECNIRLSPDIDPQIQQLACQAAEKAMGHSQQDLLATSKAFPFLALPVELRYQILQHTDLIAPYRQVDWNPRDGYYLHYSVAGCDWVCDPDDHHGCQFRQCSKHTEGHGCFCPRYHSAFSTHCHCWQPPTSLFSVCKALHEETQDVFFTQNQFIIAPVDGYGNTANTILERFEASIFLQNVLPAHLLLRLKLLEIVFPPLDEEYLSPRGQAFEDWGHTIENTKLDFPNLTLRIYFADFYTASYATPFRKNLTRQEGIERVVSAYMRIIKPLKKWRTDGLCRLFIHAAWPWSWTREGRNTRRVKEHIVKNDVALIEQHMERKVMGDGYDSVALGKNKLEKSQWLKSHERSEEYASVID